MKNVQERIVKLEKKVEILSRYILQHAGISGGMRLQNEFSRELLDLDKVPEKQIKLRKCPNCKHWWFDRNVCGCYKFPNRYTYPTSKQHEVDEQKIPCEGFRMREHRRLLRPIKGKSV
jgi:hypothetical protein